MEKEKEQSRFKKALKYFTPLEWIIYFGSLILILILFIVFKNRGWLYFAGAAIGVSSLMFDAKGNVLGQFIGIIFDILYAIISYRFGYYGEMFTYLFLSLPEAVIAIISWLRHPFKGNTAEVQINEIKLKEYILVFAGSVLFTFGIYFVLKYLNTANLILSTMSVFTCTIATYLLIRRSRFYPIFFFINDIMLIVLWIFASAESTVNVPMVGCFVSYLFIDVYTFLSWSKILKRQKNTK